MRLSFRKITLLSGVILALASLQLLAGLPGSDDKPVVKSDAVSKTETSLIEEGMQLTRSEDGNMLHVVLPAWPEGNESVHIQSLSTLDQPRYRVVDVRLDGSSDSLHWVRNSKELEIALPHERPANTPLALQIELQRKPNFLPAENRHLHHVENVLGGETYPVPEYDWASDEAYEAFLDMKYGVRIHWGVYSKLEVEASWPFRQMDHENRQEYQDLYQTFNPEQFDADEWMQFFEENHLKMFAFTTKHHDGFSMFDTKTRITQRINWTAEGGPTIESCDLAYSIMESPYGEDIVKQLCDAAHEHDIKIDLYYSHPDWYDANFRNTPRNPARGISRASDEEVEQMMLRHRNQLKELLTNYGKVDMICLDLTLQQGVWPALRQTMIELREIQPDVMFRCRSIGNYGDYYTPEGWVPRDVEKTNVPWFVIYPLGGSFAYDPTERYYRGGDWITYNLIDSTSKGGNFMVAYGPDEHGLFHPKAIEATEATGRWLDINGEAIFATRPWNVFGEGPTAEQGIRSRGRRQEWISPYTSADVRFTRSKDRKTIYAIVMGWPGDGESVTLQSIGADLAIEEISLLGHSGDITWTQGEDGLTVTMPNEKPCNYAYSLKISLE